MQAQSIKPPHKRAHHSDQQQYREVADDAEQGAERIGLPDECSGATRGYQEGGRGAAGPRQVKPKHQHLYRDTGGGGETGARNLLKNRAYPEQLHRGAHYCDQLPLQAARDGTIRHRLAGAEAVGIPRLHLH